jgi:hypothetical protein
MPGWSGQERKTDMGIVTFVQDNWAAILAAAVAIERAVYYVAKLTPTKADDAFVAKVETALASLGVKTDH